MQHFYHLILNTLLFRRLQMLPYDTYHLQPRGRHETFKNSSPSCSCLGIGKEYSTPKFPSWLKFFHMHKTPDTYKKTTNLWQQLHQLGGPRLMIKRDCFLYSLISKNTGRLLHSLEVGLQREKFSRVENRSIYHLVFAGDIWRD